jgi:hypothetical protein
MAQPAEALEDLFDGEDEHYGGDERLGYDRGPASRVPAESVERLIRKAAHTLSAASVGFRGATPRTRYGALDDIILAAGYVRLRADERFSTSAAFRAQAAHVGAGVAVGKRQPHDAGA